MFVKKTIGLICCVGLLAGCAGVDMRGEGAILGTISGAALAAASGAHRGGILAGAGVGGVAGYTLGQGYKKDRYYDEYQPSVQARGYAVVVSCQQAEVNAYNFARLRVQNEGGSIEDYFHPFHCGDR